VAKGCGGRQREVSLEIGLFYIAGLGVPKNAEEGVKWLGMSAKQGNALAQFNLGLMYMLGEGVPRDAATAAEWQHLAASQDLAVAQLALGALYGVGLGVEKNEAEAIKWMQKAAAQGNAIAQLSLGIRYASGMGVPKDSVEGFAWLSLGVQGISAQRERKDESGFRADYFQTELGLLAQTAGRPFEECALELYEDLKTELAPPQVEDAQKRIARLKETVQKP
jgi:TPR repeat protein